MSVTADTATTLTAADRCDRCGARAHLSATMRGGILLFCAHHAREHHAALIKAGALIGVENAP